MNGAPSVDDFLTLSGQRLWALSYGRGGDDADAFRIAAGWEQTTAGTPSNLFVHQYAFAAKWAQDGFPKITTTHKFAAALAATRVARDMVDEIHVPGRAFIVAVPNGILEIPYGARTRVPVGDRGQTRDYDRIAVATFDVGGAPLATMLLLDRQTSGATCQLLIGTSLADVLFEELDDVQSDTWNDGERAVVHDEVNDKDAKARLVTLARRIVVGLLLTMQDTDNMHTRNKARASKSNRSGPPKHRVMFVGRPIDIDCRPEIVRYLRGAKHAPPSVQTLVRGHHKRQVVGIGRTGRKVIWVQPHWRGPEDAPILTRPILVRHPDEAK